MAMIDSATQSKTHAVLSKVPEVTLAFWIIKILATTLGETGGDAVSMTLNLGYAVASLIFLCFFAATLAAQMSIRRYRAFCYWAVVVATTTVGTTLSDYCDRTLGLGYIKSSLFLLAAVIAILLIWRLACGRIQFENINSRRDELFYWVTILVSNTLGTALGDFMASDAGLGFERGALVFAVMIGLVAAGYIFLKKTPASLYFWSAYVLTRPLGATLGDTLTKSHEEGGLSLDRIVASLLIAVAMIGGIVLSSRPIKTKDRSHHPV